MGGRSKILQLILLVTFTPSSCFSLTTTEDQSYLTSTAEYESSSFEFTSSVKSNLIASSTNIPITEISTIDKDQTSSETNAVTAIKTSKTVTLEPITTQENTTEKIIVITNTDLKNNTANLEVTSISSTSLTSDTSSKTLPTSTASSSTTQARTTTSAATVPTAMTTTSVTTVPTEMSSATTVPTVMSTATTVPTVISTASATTVLIAMSTTSESISTHKSSNMTSAETTALTSTESITKSSSPIITPSESLSSMAPIEQTTKTVRASSSAITTESSTRLKTSESQTTTILSKTSTKPSTLPTTTPLSTSKEVTTAMTTNSFINEIDSLNSNISELNDRITALRVAVAVLSVLLAMVVIGCILYFVRQRMRPVKSPFEEMHGDKVDVERSKDEVTRRPYFNIAHNPYRASTASLGGEDNPASFSATFKPQGHAEAELNASLQGIVMEEIPLNDGNSLDSPFTHNQDFVARNNNVDV